jgi:hypothetical protein
MRAGALVAVAVLELPTALVPSVIAVSHAMVAAFVTFMARVSSALRAMITTYARPARVRIVMATSW